MIIALVSIFTLLLLGATLVFFYNDNDDESMVIFSVGGILVVVFALILVIHEKSIENTKEVRACRKEVLTTLKGLERFSAGDVDAIVSVTCKT